MKQIKRFHLLLPVVLTLLLLSCNQKPGKKENVESNGTVNHPVVQPQQKAPDKSLLVGDWARTDAPYQLKISKLSDGGMMKVGYFNPKSINVAKAQWDSAGGMLRIYVELRDQNYPGSNYNLTYLPERDLLTGKYYQAVEGTTYEVGFFRTR
jgi:hypothetical protein